jgi:hypothetical protein
MEVRWVVTTAHRDWRIFSAFIKNGNKHSEQARAQHKQKKGRAPAWGSEFTTKAATPHGKSQKN